MIYQIIYKEDSGIKPLVNEVAVLGLKNLLENIIKEENYQKVRSITLITDDDMAVDMWLGANGFD